MTDVAVDAGGMFIGDQTLLPENIDQYDVFKKVFGSPMRRSQTLANGVGCIIDTDDGVLDVSVCEHRHIHSDDSISEFRFYAVVRSGILTVCSVDFLVSRCEPEAEPGKCIRHKVAQGTYSVRVVCSVVSSDGTERGASSVVDGVQASKFAVARGDWIFGRMEKEEYDKVVADYEDSKLWFRRRIEVWLEPVQSIPDGWEAEDPVFEYKPSNADVHAVLVRRNG